MKNKRSINEFRLKPFSALCKTTVKSRCTISFPDAHVTHECVKAIAVLSCVTCIALSLIIPSIQQPAFAATAPKLILRTNQQVYSQGEQLIVYGAGVPNDDLVIRLFDPVGRGIRIDNIQVDEDGFFRESIFEWPTPSRTLPFGTYTVEAIPSAGPDKVAQKIQVIFGELSVEDQLPDTTLIGSPVVHTLAVKLDAPDQVTVARSFRIFVQVTFDGVLLDAREVSDVTEILGGSHIHAGKGNSTISLSDKFIELHEGIFYADVSIPDEGAYIIHAEAFHSGYLSHDSKVIAVSTGTISTIQETVDDLSQNLNATNHELAQLEEGLSQTKFALEDTKTSITDAVEGATSTIDTEIESMRQASGQINSLILPVLALISVIIALQISLFARIRASYR